MPRSPALLEWKRIRRRFTTPLRTASGAYAGRESLVVRAQTEAGTGYAESAPWPGFAAPGLDAVEQALLRARIDLTRGADALMPGPVRGALDWARLGWGGKRISRPCAGLLRADADAPALLAAGYRTLKRKIGVETLREEQRAVAGLVRAAGPDIAWRLDANGALTVRDCEAWCDFLSEFAEIEWLEQPLRAGAEDGMRAIGERAGVAHRLALDESLCAPESAPKNWPGILVVKPALTGDTHAWRSLREAHPGLAYGSAFESPFGRQAALCLAGEDPRSATRALGFGTLGAFADTLDRHAPGPVAITSATDWDALWESL